MKELKTYTQSEKTTAATGKTTGRAAGGAAPNAVFN